MPNYSVKEVSDLLSKSEETIKRWLLDDVFPNAFKGDNRKWFIPNIDLEKFKNTNNLQIIKFQNSLIGKKYGFLTITDVIGYKIEYNNHQRLYIVAKCDCGSSKEYPFYTLDDGRVKRCSKSCILNSNFYIGQKFNNLTIICDEGLQFYGNQKKKRRYVRTVCTCGNERTVSLQNLKSNKVKSCSKSCSLKRNNQNKEVH